MSLYPDCNVNLCFPKGVNLPYYLYNCHKK